MSKKRVRTLLRVSSKQQLHDDDVPLQRAEAEQYIKKHPDWEFDREYIEKAVSAYKNTADEREVLQEILSDAANKEFDILLTYMSDRIGRQEEYSFYVATLNQLGIEVWTIKEGQLKTEGRTDRLLNFIRFWQNEGESEKTSARVRDAHRETIKAGKFVGGKAPYGYRLVYSGEISNHGRQLHKLEIVEEKAEVVRKIFSLAVYQGYGADRIAKALNEEGIPSEITDKWKRGTISSILKNPVYMGYPCIHRRKNHKSYVRLDRKDWIYSEEQVKDIVIVSQEIWEKAQEIREARKAKIQASKESASKLHEELYSVPFSTRGKLALMGITRCGYCGKNLRNGSYANHWTTKNGEEKVSFVGRYYCPEKCKERATYSQSYLEGIVFEVVERYMERLKAIDISEEIEKMHSEQKKGIEKEIKQFQKDLRKCQLDIETLEEHIPEALRGDYFFSAEKLSAMIKEKEQEVTDLQTSIKMAQRRLRDTIIQQEDMEQFICSLPNWKEEFRSADVQTKKMILATIIDVIEVKNDSINIKFKIRLDDYIDGVAFESSIHNPATESIACDNESKKTENTGENLLLETSGMGTIQCTRG